MPITRNKAGTFICEDCVTIIEGEGEAGEIAAATHLLTRHKELADVLEHVEIVPTGTNRRQRRRAKEKRGRGKKA